MGTLARSARNMIPGCTMPFAWQSNKEMPAGMKPIITLVLAAACFRGCAGSGGDGNNPPINASATGNWSGSIEFHTSIFATAVDMFIIQTGTSISAKLVQLDGGCSVLGSMTRSANGDNLSMTIIGGGSNCPDVTTITVTLVGGDAILGTCTTSGRFDNGDTCKFEAGLVS
jgi:hypothetical protein